METVEWRKECFCISDELKLSKINQKVCPFLCSPKGSSELWESKNWLSSSSLGKWSMPQNKENIKKKKRLRKVSQLYVNILKNIFGLDIIEAKSSIWSSMKWRQVIPMLSPSHFRYSIFRNGNDSASLLERIIKVCLTCLFQGSKIMTCNHLGFDQSWAGHSPGTCIKWKPAVGLLATQC